MAMGGLRPVVAVYSTFFSRAFDQANLDVGLHGLPVIFALDRAGITGPDGPSHHGVLDMALCLKIPGMTIFAPSSAQEVPVMLETALSLTGPAAIRWPRTAARYVSPDQVGIGPQRPPGPAGAGRPARSVCLLAVGKMLEAAEEAADILCGRGQRGHGLGRPGGAPARPADDRRRRSPRPDRDRRGRGAVGRGRVA